jgi:hypothetical protein
MLSRVPRVVIYCAVAAVSFWVGGRMEPLLLERGKALPAQAAALAGPAALRLGEPAPFNSGVIHNDAIQAGAVAEQPASEPVALQAKAEGDEKPSIVTGRDPETDAEFVEMKHMPEIHGQGETDPAPARDVDMIGEQGLPVPDSKNGSTDASASN